jgi:hypothetical protein
VSDADAVVQAEKRLAAAHISLDLTTIADLLHGDYVIVQPDGRIETKADVLASYGSGERHWEQAEVEQLDVALYGVAKRRGWLVSGRRKGQTRACRSIIRRASFPCGCGQAVDGRISPMRRRKSLTVDPLKRGTVLSETAVGLIKIHHG